ncbi:SDR family oxidoreductase [Deinococcus planocerae]|uniref:SDR family oxidoreductase n=1 Tax=Deinococcus planocerae TaxID=1737569 RepID=UPI000C7EA0E6|nr:SDR family oxidoreductase [Deinococcus planocerae]
MQGKTVLITGATGGIGQATARALARQGARVVIVGRDARKAQAVTGELRDQTGNADVDFLIADLSSLASVRLLARDFRANHPHLHVLINNAGGVNQTRQVTPDGYELTFAVNHLAPFVLTQELLGTLRATPGARIVNVSSSAQAQGHIDFGDLMGERRYSPMRAYYQSKLANVLFTYELARRLAGSGVTANALHPGVVNSGFGGDARGVMGLAMRAIKRFGSVTPGEGARTSVYLASSPEVEGVTGKYFEKEKAVASGKESYDEEVARRLWDVSERLARKGVDA